MKKVILTFGVLFVVFSAFSQTQQAPKPGAVPPAQNKPAVMPPMPGQDPMGMSPAAEQIAEQAEEADAKGANGAILNPDQRADKWIERVGKNLNLTPAQKQQIRPMVLNTFVQKDQIKKQAGGDMNKARPMLHQINIQCNQMLRQTLNPEQWSQYVQARNQQALPKPPVPTPTK